MTIRERDLRKQDALITIKVPIWLVLVASILFAIVFFIVGSIFRHYPSLLGVI